jgi:spoIIIJ-associated protein
MNEKKGLFGSFKSWIGGGEFSEEEKQQREHARAQSGNSVKKEKEDQGEGISQEVELFCVEKLEELLSMCQFSGKVKAKNERRRLVLEIFDAGEDTGRLIGKSGGTVESLQILIRGFVVRKFQENTRLLIDVEGYRGRRFSQVKSKALKAADTVKRDGQSISLEPMNSSERRSVHMLFEKDKQVQTVSEGQGQNRHVVLENRA